jgi:hypothetical protein
LAALVLLLTLWTGARMMLWESPFASPFPAAAAAGAHFTSATLPVSKGRLSTPELRDNGAPRIGQDSLPLDPRVPAGAKQVWPLLAVDRPRSTTIPDATGWAVPLADPFRPFVQPGLPVPRTGASRWHVAGWAAWRAGSGLTRIANGARAASYGGSQAGIAARIDLAGGGHRPALHLRATYAPDRPRQGELALGAGVRPLAAVPLRIMAEVRATRSEGRAEVRPALLAVTELAPIDLPLAVVAEGYAQAGWVGGRYATAFADGQIRVTREFAAYGPARVRLGAGVWGGAQKFAERLDVGPTIALDLAAGPVPARLAVDYRIQVAGDASPGNGVALTLSTGF